MKKIVISVILVCYLVTLAWAASKGQVKTNKVNFGLTGGSDADDTVKIERPSAAVMRFTSGAGVTTLADLIGNAASTSRTGVTQISAQQGSTIVWAGDSNVLFSSGNASSVGSAVRSPFGTASQQAEWMSQHNPLLWETDIYQEGDSGGNSANLFARIDDIMDHPGIRTAGDPDIAIIQVGGNDIVQTSPIAVDDFIDNMTSTTRAINTSGTVPIIVNIMDMSFGAYIENVAITNDAELDALISSYNSRLKIMAEQEEVAYFDLNDLMGTASDTNPFYVSQTAPVAGGEVHLSFAGHRHLATEMLNFLSDRALINSMGKATATDVFEYNDPLIILQNQGSLTAASNETITIVEVTAAGADTIVNHPYRLMTNNTGGDIQVISFTFKGTGVAISAGTGTLGNLDVILDSGTPIEVSMQATLTTSTPGEFTGVIIDTVWSSRNLDYAEHTLEVELKNNAATDDFWFFGMVVERGAANNPIVTDFPTVISAPSITIEDIDTSDDTITGLLAVTGDNSASPRQTVTITDADFIVPKTGTENLITALQLLNRVGFKVTAPELGVHMESGDGVLFRDTRVAATVFSPIMTRDEYSDGDIDAITWGESVGGSLTADEMATLAMEVDDATDGSLDTTLLFSTTINNALAPVLRHNHDFTRLYQPVWIQGDVLTGQTPGSGVLLFLDDSTFNTLAYLIADPAGGSGLFFGDDDNNAQGGLFYNHATETLDLSVNATNRLLLDDNRVSVVYGDSGATPKVDARLFVEDDSACFVQVASTSVTSVGVLFSDDNLNTRGSIIVSSVDEMDIRSSSDITIGSDAFPTSIFVESSSGDVGIGFAAPEQDLHIQRTAATGSATPQSNALLVLENDTSTNIQFLSPVSAIQQILFGDNDNDIGGLLYSHASNKMQLRVNAVNAVTIDSSQRVGLGADDPSSILDIRGVGIGIELDAVGSGDATIHFLDDGVVEWTMGVDESLSDIFKIAASSAVETSTGLVINTSLMTGLNDSSPDFRLEVAVSAGGGYFALSSTQGSDGDVFIVNANEDVGIHQDTPLALLHVEDGDYDPPGGATNGLLALFINEGDDVQNLGVAIQAGELDGAGGSQTFMIFFDGDGTSVGGIKQVTGGGVAIFQASDGMKKKNIRDSQRNAKNIIRDMRIRDYEWKDSESTKTQTGPIAQELYALYPDAVQVTTGTRELETGTTVTIQKWFTTDTIKTDTMWVNESSASVLTNADGTTQTTITIASVPTITTHTVEHDILVDVDKWIPDMTEDIDWYWAPSKMIPILILETQRQQKQIDNLQNNNDYLWGAVSALFSAMFVLVVIVRKLAKGQPITADDLAKIAELKSQLEARIGEMDK